MRQELLPCASVWPQPVVVSRVTCASKNAKSVKPRHNRRALTTTRARPAAQPTACPLPIDALDRTSLRRESPRAPVPLVSPFLRSPTLSAVITAPSSSIPTPSDRTPRLPFPARGLLTETGRGLAHRTTRREAWNSGTAFSMWLCTFRTSPRSLSDKPGASAATARPLSNYHCHVASSSPFVRHSLVRLCYPSPQPFFRLPSHIFFKPYFTFHDISVPEH